MFAKIIKAKTTIVFQKNTVKHFYLTILSYIFKNCKHFFKSFYKKQNFMAKALK